jgi:hypothetical protein
MQLKQRLIEEQTRKFERALLALEEATGKLAQAEVLHEKIADAMRAVGSNQHVHLIATAHDHYDPPVISTWAYVSNGSAAQIRSALNYAGLKIAAETPQKSSIGDEVCITLADFPEFYIDIGVRAVAMPEAA